MTHVSEIHWDTGIAHWDIEIINWDIKFRKLLKSLYFSQAFNIC